MSKSVSTKGNIPIIPKIWTPSPNSSWDNVKLFLKVMVEQFRFKTSGKIGVTDRNSAASYSLGPLNQDTNINSVLYGGDVGFIPPYPGAIILYDDINHSNDPCLEWTHAAMVIGKDSTGTWLVVDQASNQPVPRAINGSTSDYISNIMIIYMGQQE